jgi:hypothetical protein
MSRLSGRSPRYQDPHASLSVRDITSSSAYDKLLVILGCLANHLTPRAPRVKHEIVGVTVDIRSTVQIARFTRDIESSRTKSETHKPTGSAFIQFHNRIAAHLPCQAVVHGVPHKMTPCIPEVNPEDVIWSNLTLSWQQRWVRTCMSLTLSIAFILFYAVPVAFTSLLANLDLPAARFEWLSWLSSWPSTLRSVVQGILPPALLQVMLLVVPLAYRDLAYLQGAATYTIKETRVQNWYFVFLFTQVCSCQSASIHDTHRHISFPRSIDIWKPTWIRSQRYERS